jgi:lysozyme
MTAKPVCQAAIDLVKYFEGLHLTAHRCPAGTPTVGYGRIARVTVGQIITAEQAEAFLATDLAAAAAQVDRLVNVRLNENQRGALASFAFTLGTGVFAGSTLLKLLNAGDYQGAAGQFGRWVYANINGTKTQLPGLVARRAAEFALFQGQTAQTRTGVTTANGNA